MKRGDYFLFLRHRVYFAFLRPRVRERANRSTQTATGMAADGEADARRRTEKETKDEETNVCSGACRSRFGVLAAVYAHADKRVAHLLLHLMHDVVGFRTVEAAVSGEILQQVFLHKIGFRFEIRRVCGHFPLPNLLEGLFYLIALRQKQGGAQS